MLWVQTPHVSTLLSSQIVVLTLRVLSVSYMCICKVPATYFKRNKGFVFLLKKKDIVSFIASSKLHSENRIIISWRHWFFLTNKRVAFKQYSLYLHNPLLEEDFDNLVNSANYFAYIGWLAQIKFSVPNSFQCFHLFSKILYSNYIYFYNVSRITILVE